MKKIVLFAAGLMTLAACQENNGYTIKGTVAGAVDGEYVYLQTSDRAATVLDSAEVKGGQFKFTGVPELAAIPKTLSYSSKEGKMRTMLFLDKGNISVVLDRANSSVGGTENNDAFTKFMDEYKDMNNEMQEIYNRYRTDSTLNETQRNELMVELDKKEEGQKTYIFNQMSANITKPFGAFLLNNFGLALEVEKLNGLLPQVPAELASEESIVRLKEYVANTMNTAVGKKFVDFTMKTPEGEDVKLSDFISKNKYTLVDFWASWCGPCRREMPFVVEAYKQYKSKGFGIVGVSLDQDAAQWKEAIKSLNITWPQMSDLKGWQCEGAKLYGVRGIPATVLVDQEGTIVARDLRGDALAKKVGELLNK